MMRTIFLPCLAAFVLVTTGGCRSFDSPAAAQNERFVREFAATEVSALRIAAVAGDVVIRGGDGNQATVVASTTGDCKIDATLRHGAVGVVLHGKQFWSRCRGTLTVEVPRALVVDVSTGDGDLSIDEVAGTLSLRTGSGDMRVEGDITELVAKSGSGDVEVRGLRGPAIVSTGSGNVSLTYATLPEGTLRLAQGAGDTQLMLPHGPIVTDVTVGSGAVNNQVQTDPTARFAVRGTIGSGNLSIRSEG